MQIERPEIGDITYEPQSRVLLVRDTQGRLIGTAARSELDEVAIMPTENGRGWLLVFLIDPSIEVPDLRGRG